MPPVASPPAHPIESCFCDQDAEQRIDVDRVLTALAHRRRRAILGLLDQRPEWTRAELALTLVDVEEPPERLDEAQVETSLVHRHLSTLESARRVIEGGGGTIVRRGEDFGVVRAMVDAATSVTRRE